MKYDYYIIPSCGNTLGEYENRLKNLGRDGWRVVSFSSQNSGSGLREIYTALLEKEIK